METSCMIISAALDTYFLDRTKTCTQATPTIPHHYSHVIFDEPINFSLQLFLHVLPCAMPLPHLLMEFHNLQMKVYSKGYVNLSPSI
uniref:Uncharacterized protein n=1 Tax=Rhizophora mucronata TaxID=61149 RepID=A0A2P2NIH8_RHIMU